MYRLRTAITISLFLALAASMAVPAMAQSGSRKADPLLGGYQATIVAVGDIACAARVPVTPFECQHGATQRLTESLNPDRVLVLGDTQYFDGTAEEYEKGYDPTWGRLKPITIPVVGNHEYHTPGATGYYDYFGAVAGNPAEGWHSNSLAGWRLIGLNSMCSQVGGCIEGSPQQLWLQNDLKMNPARCTIAFWHHPRYSSTRSRRGGTNGMWRTLQSAGADIVLAGHDHDYERFAPMNVNGTLNYRDGMRSFVVGTGGQNLFDPGVEYKWTPGSEAFLSEFGVLKLTLYELGYRWEFVNTSGVVRDSGADACHGKPRKPVTKPAPKFPVPGLPAGR